jgi:hypothetical protein
VRIGSTDTPRFELPVRGRGLVSESGADFEHNHHVDPSVPNQRHAYDLLGLDAQGRAFVDDGDRVEEWVGWGMPVVAAGDGVVIGAVDGQRDIAIGEDLPDGDHPAGNRVAIRHDDGSVTWYAHMQRGSVLGDLLGTRIAAGTVLGLLGNSGNTTAPHLHVQRQVGADGSMDPAAVGVELAFEGARLVGSYDFTPTTGFTNWRPATEQAAHPRVARRGDVLEPVS